MDNLKASHVNKSKTENPDELRKKKGSMEPPSEMNREKSNEQLFRTRDKLSKDRSNEDLSLSSQSKA